MAKKMMPMKSGIAKNVAKAMGMKDSIMKTVKQSVKPPVGKDGVPATLKRIKSGKHK